MPSAERNLNFSLCITHRRCVGIVFSFYLKQENKQKFGKGLLSASPFTYLPPAVPAVDVADWWKYEQNSPASPVA